MEEKFVVYDPGNNYKISEIFAFISTDNDGNEGVCGYSTKAGMLPMIGADMARIETLRPMAKALAGMTKKKIQLIKFKVREDLEVIEP